MFRKLVFLSIVLFLFASCATTKTQTAKTIDIYGSVVHKPIIADLQVQSQKITGTASFQSLSSLEAAKNTAVAEALKKANADVLIEPSFQTVTSNGKTTVTVAGWAGSYKNFRNANSEDLPFLQSGVMQKAQIFEPSTETKKGSPVLWVLLGLIGIGAAVYGSQQ